jgi:hypothetical protein
MKTPRWFAWMLGLIGCVPKFVDTTTPVSFWGLGRGLGGLQNVCPLPLQVIERHRVMIHRAV